MKSLIFVFAATAALTFCGPVDALSLDKLELETNIDWKAYKAALMKAQKSNGDTPFVSGKAIKIWLAEAIEKNGGPDKVKPEDIEKIWKLYLSESKAKARASLGY